MKVVVFGPKFIKNAVRTKSVNIAFVPGALSNNDNDAGSVLGEAFDMGR